jgi:mannosyltransferase
MKIQKVPLSLALIILLGAGLRLYGVGAEGIWLDEGVSIARAGSSFSRIIGGWGTTDPSPPLYYLLLHFWMGGFGDSELSIRLPSVIFGVLAILLAYRAGAELWNRETGLTAAFILALAAFPVYFSREARMYSLLLLLSLASYYSLVRLIRKGGTAQLFLYLLPTAGVLYTHNLGITIVLAQNIYLLAVFSKGGRAGELTARRWYAIQGLLLLFYLPGLNSFLVNLRFVQSGYWTPRATAIDLWRTIRLYGGSASATALLCGLAAVDLSRPGRLPEKSRDGGFLPGERLFLTSWLLTPILLPFLASLVSNPIYMPRITIAAAPALYLLAAQGLDRMPGRGPRTALAVLLGILLILPLGEFYRPPRNEPWREVVRLIEEAARPGDGVLVSPPWYRFFCFEHYRTRTDLETRGVPEDVFTGPGIPRLKEETRKHPRTWIVDFQERDLSPLLEENFPGRLQAGTSRMLDYDNFQAGRRLGIRVYLLDAGDGN